MPRYSKDTPDGELEEIVEKEEFLSILKKNAICNQRFLLFFRKGKKGSPFRPK
jgi:hypothetical protein